MSEHFTIVLAGNPNVGKSTVFNALTGMKQHTGNWAGKTVEGAEGSFSCGDTDFTLIDTPGTYSLRGGSAEEVSARDIICFGGADAVIVVCDATCLQRNLCLVLQIMEIAPRVMVCVNLMDEARSKGISIDIPMLSKLLGVPVSAMSARNGEGIGAFTAELCGLVRGEPQALRRTDSAEPFEEAAAQVETLLDEDFTDVPRRYAAMRLLENDTDVLKKIEERSHHRFEENEQLTSLMEKLREQGISPESAADSSAEAIMNEAAAITEKSVHTNENSHYSRDRRLDRIFMSRRFGTPVMLLLFALILWITIVGANYPSELLSRGLFALGERLSQVLSAISAPEWLNGVLVQGIYRAVAWVVSVMLPPMAIFFPFFTLLEDLGYLPRIAFNLDHCFRCSGACGKQAITMAMGFGCNACGVTGCRIIDSPRERLIAVLTNSFVPCNGRFPTMIAMISMFFVTARGAASSILSAIILLVVILLGVFMTLGVSKLLSVTILRGAPSAFTLELPPYRIPQVRKVLIRSVLDRTVFVLARACTAAAPCGLIIWLMANIHLGGGTILSQSASFLHPFASLMGLDGAVLLAFILGFPANEIVVPIILMSYLSQGSLIELSSTEQLRALLTDNGWTLRTAVCMVLFTLFHFPCATTCLTIKKETGSLKWTALSFLLPTAAGMILCFLVNTVWKSIM